MANTFEELTADNYFFTGTVKDGKEIILIFNSCSNNPPVYITEKVYKKLQSQYPEMRKLV
jgi:hypothetical protein